jgi:hypothetical protein
MSRNSSGGMNSTSRLGEVGRLGESPSAGGPKDAPANVLVISSIVAHGWEVVGARLEVGGGVGVGD